MESGHNKNVANFEQVIIILTALSLTMRQEKYKTKFMKIELKVH